MYWTNTTISERSSSTKLKLNESTKRNAWLSWRATNSEECDVVWRNGYYCFLAHLASLLLKPWCTTIEQGDTTQPAVVEAVIAVLLLPETVQLKKSEDKRTALVAGCENETKQNNIKKMEGNITRHCHPSTS